MHSAGLSRLAPAKINLFLHVTGKRDDGYHSLESLVVFAQDPAACDRVTAMPADSISLIVDGPRAAQLNPVDDENLVLRAAACGPSMVRLNASAGAMATRSQASVSCAKTTRLSSS